MRLRFGLAALSNKHFDHALFPLRTLHAEYLPRYAEVFDALELSQLYHSGEPDDRILGWLDQAPDGFTFPVKLWKQAVAPEEKVWGADELTAADQAVAALAPLRDAGRLGPVVAQFPPSFQQTRATGAWLADLLDRVPAPVAVELRHPSWWTDATRTALKDRGVALVWGTHPKAPAPDWMTAEFGYVRFTGRAFHQRGRHVTAADRLDAVLDMRARLERAEAGGIWDECFVIVTNPFEGNAVDSLPRIAAALGDTKLAKRVTRQPGEVLFPDATRQARS